VLAITGITLIAGFASTIGWPMTAVFLHASGWRFFFQCMEAIGVQNIHLNGE
jgi:hypothetical protein